MTKNKLKRINKKTLKLLMIIIVLILVLIGVFFLIRSNNTKLAKPSDVIKTNGNTQLQANINAFMESHMGILDNGQSWKNSHCDNILYGYDDKYAYALVTCSGDIIENNTILVQNSGFSIPTRFEYQPNNLQIIDFTQQGEDNKNPSLQQIFPKQIIDIYTK